MCSNDWKQIDTICFRKLLSDWNTRFKLTAKPTMCYTITMEVKNYIIFHCDSFSAVQLEKVSYESLEPEYITHSP